MQGLKLKALKCLKLLRTERLLLQWHKPHIAETQIIYQLT